VDADCIDLDEVRDSAAADQVFCLQAVFASTATVASAV
jgi:hypothetical protein